VAAQDALDGCGAGRGAIPIKKWAVGTTIIPLTLRASLTISIHSISHAHAQPNGGNVISPLGNINATINPPKTVVTGIKASSRTIIQFNISLPPTVSSGEWSVSVGWTCGLLYGCIGHISWYPSRRPPPGRTRRRPSCRATPPLGLGNNSSSLQSLLVPLEAGLCYVKLYGIYRLFVSYVGLGQELHFIQ